jgi:hypothetical protein
VSHWNRLAVVAPLALLVTGGVAAVYQGPVPPVNATDANAALKAARARSHVMFDPADYIGDGTPAEPSTGFLGKFKPDLSYYRNRIVAPIADRADRVALVHLSATSGPTASASDTPEGDTHVADPTFFEMVRETEGGSPADLTHLLDPQFRMAGGIPAPADGNLTSDNGARIAALASAGSGRRAGAGGEDEGFAEDTDASPYTAGLGTLPTGLLAKGGGLLSFRAASGTEFAFTQFDMERGAATVPQPLFVGTLLPNLSNAPVVQRGSIASVPTQVVGPLPAKAVVIDDFSAFLSEAPEPAPEPGTFTMAVLGIFTAAYVCRQRV